LAEKKKIVSFQRSASFIPSSFNTDDNTIEVVAATEAEVLTYNWDYGRVREVLSMKPGEVRLDRLNAKAQVLDNHNSFGSIRQAVLGVVDEARIDNGQLIAKVRFSSREDLKPFIEDVKNGIYNNVSIQYRIYKAVVTEEDGTLPLLRAVDWEPFEVSFVSVPADYNAGARSQNTETHDCEILNTSNSKKQNMNRSSEILKLVRAAGLSIDFAQTLIDDETIDMDKARSMVDAEKAKLQKPAAPTEEQLRQAEKVRRNEIVAAVRAAKLEDAYALELIGNDAMTVDQARAAIIDKLASTASQQRNTPAANAGIQVNADETDKRRSGIENAILVRAGQGGDATKLGEYRGARMIDLARLNLESEGVKVRGMSQKEIAQAALNIDQSRSSFSSSDFPITLGNTVNRVLRRAYDLAPRTFTPFVRRATASDFRTMTRVQLGDLAALEKIVEGGEYKSFSLGENGESYKVAKYGKIINLTWEMLVNDDLDAFSRIPSMFGNAAAQTQSDLVYGILTGNPNMSDSVAVFHANHGNLAAAGTVIDVTNMGKARAAMRKQKSLGGQFLNLSPKFLVVGPDKEQEALQISSSQYTANTTGNINVWQGLVQPIVEGRLTGNQWYMAADPAQIDTIETAFLDGEELFTETRNGFEVDGMQIKARMVFAAKTIDYRGLYKNPGA
jgi:hypothetical protein